MALSSVLPCPPDQWLPPVATDLLLAASVCGGVLLNRLVSSETTCCDSPLAL